MKMKLKMPYQDYLKEIEKAEFVKSFVCEQKGIEIDSLMTKSKSRELSMIKFECMYLINCTTNITKTDNAKIFNRKHSQAIRACKVVEEVLSYSKHFATEINSLKTEINNHFKN